MSDSISRQAAIDVLLQHPFEKVVNCISILEELPSAQPEKRTEEHTETHACDSISRQAAINAMSEALKRVFSEHRQIAEKCLNALPSAEPEIIRCKDCKYRDENWRRVSVKWLPCMDMRTGSNWYCGSAERRTDD